MKNIIVIVFLFSAIFTGCKKPDIAKGTPECIEKRIKDFDKSATCNDPKVKQYKFQGNDVFCFENGTCGADLTTEVFSSECTSLGHLGGITGNTKINGEEFRNAIFVQTIWEK